MSRPPLGSALSLFGLDIAWYSLLMMTAVAVGILLAMREEKRLGLPRDTILNFALLAIPLGVVGARLYYVAFTWNRYADNLGEIFRVWNGGLAIYGAVLGGLLAAFIITRSGKVKLSTLLDACAPSLVLGQAIGRWGNYANMEAYGARVYEEAMQFFPFAVEVPIGGVWYWHMATFFYEFVWCMVVFIVLMLMRKKTKRSGDTLCWYLLLYCAGRTVIEGLRDDSLLLNVAAAQIRVSQILSAVVCLGVLIVFFVRLASRKKLHLADWLCWGIVLGGLACTFVSEFERNAYQDLFTVSQLLLGLLLTLDIVFLIHYLRRAKKFGTPAAWMLIGAVLCGAMLLAGIGRLGERNLGYIALRQSVAMAHMVLPGAWFYLRAGAGKRRRAARTPMPEETE